MGGSYWSFSNCAPGRIGITMIRNDHSAARATKNGTNDASRTSGSTASHRRRSIASRLTIWFLAISLVPCALLTTVTARIAVHALENSVRTRLVQIAAAKADEIEVYTLQRVDDGTTLAHSKDIIAAMAQLRAASAGTASAPSTGVSTTESAALRTKLESTLVNAASVYEFSQLLMIDLSGRVLYALDGSVEVGESLDDERFRDTELSAGFDRARTLLQSDLGGFELFGASAEPLAFVTSPIISDGRVIGVLAAGLGPQRIWRILSDLSGLGETGDIVAGERRGNKFLITKPLRSASDAAFQLQFELGSGQTSAAVRSASGDRGYGVVPDIRGIDVAAAWCYLPSLRWGMAVKQDASEAFALVRFQRNAIIGLSVATIVGVTLTALLVARSISKPIATAVRVARQVADGDLRTDVGVTAQDETGALLDAIQTMSDDLRGLIGRIQSSSSVLLATATAMQSTSGGQRQVVTEFGATTSDAAAAVRQITGTSQELARTMSEVNEMASRTGARAEEGRQDLAGMDATMQELARSTTSFSAKLATISERATTINRVVGTMTKVANQTNLLSLNAALEAERAGKYGLGFRVVASEISRLADQTAVAALDIEQMVKDMQHSVHAGVNEMQAFDTQVQGGVVRIGDISAKLGEIISAVQGISGRFEQVTEGMCAQSQGAEQIREAMARLSDGASRTAASLNEFNVATTNLRGAVDELNGEVTRFIV